MSVTSTDSKLADHKYVLGRYLYYKTLSKDLLKCNEENEQELHTTINKLELKNLELNDALSHLEEKTKEIEDMKVEMQNLKTGIDKIKKTYEHVEEENKIFSSEIIDLKSQLEEMSLSNKAKLLALESMKNDTKKLQVVQTADDKVSAHIEDLGKCDFWWCPKHSNLIKISKKLMIKTINDKVEVDMALKRQKYWFRDGQIRCCVFDRKTGADKHTEPPDCRVEYTTNQEGLIDLSSFKSLKISTNYISSDEDL